MAIWLFVITHLDTLAVLTAFCADDAYRLREILLGHAVGFTLGLVGAVFFTFLAEAFLYEWTFLLGLVPLGIGVWGLFRRRSESTPRIDGHSTSLGRIGVVVGVGIGLSGENIAIFVPFFISLTSLELAVVIAVYFIGAALVFLAAFVFALWAVDFDAPTWLDQLLVPTILIVVGMYVLTTGWFAL